MTSMRSSDHLPSLPRVILGFALGAVVPTVILLVASTSLMGVQDGLGLTIVASKFGLPPTLLIAALGYWLLRRHVAPTALASIVAGTLAATLPWVFAEFFSAGTLIAAVISIPLGAIAGLTFWLVALRMPAVSRPTNVS
jgi:hypothetical protein